MGNDRSALNEIDSRIMDALISGMRDKEIASLLGLSHRTIRNRMGIICDKLGAKHRAQAAAIYANSRS